MSNQPVSTPNPQPIANISDVVADLLENPGRRGILMGSAATAALAFVGASVAMPAVAADSSPQARTPRGRPAKLGFKAVAKHRDDVLTVPEGYTANVLFRLGDPIAANVPAYRNDGTDSAASFAHRAGDHHDAIVYFGLGRDGRYAPSSTIGLLVMNHEAITPPFLHPNGVTSTGSGAA